MRLNKYIAHHWGVSRRAADELITSGKVLVDGSTAVLGQQLSGDSKIEVEGSSINPKAYVYVAVNKPIGYVCSRKSQDGNPTIYSLLKEGHKNLKTIGRLDKDSSGLVILTNDGDFAQTMTHPKFAKQKIYICTLERTLSDTDLNSVNTKVALTDGPSAFKCIPLGGKTYKIEMREGRNRQIRRTFGALEHTVVELKRIEFGPFKLGELKLGGYSEVNLQ